MICALHGFLGRPLWVQWLFPVCTPFAWGTMAAPELGSPDPTVSVPTVPRWRDLMRLPAPAGPREMPRHPLPSALSSSLEVATDRSQRLDNSGRDPSRPRPPPGSPGKPRTTVLGE